jgi:hypothetical protein
LKDEFNDIITQANEEKKRGIDPQKPEIGRFSQENTW